jgi:protein-tyrosine phosphatase
VGGSEVSRTLLWSGLFNVRDLGGLPAEDGASTRFGVVIRADNVRRLHDARTLVDHGVTQVVDLRYPEELGEDVIDQLPVEVIHISLFGRWNAARLVELEERMLATTPHDYLRWSYLDVLDRFSANFGSVVSAVAGAPADGAVCVHSVGGRDRTGLVSALLLRLAGVSIADGAGDYAASEKALAEDHARWAAEAPDDEERARRMIFAEAPAQVMADVLAELERRHGPVHHYLRGAGVPDHQLDTLRTRLREGSDTPSDAPRR